MSEGNGIGHENGHSSENGHAHGNGYGVDKHLDAIEGEVKWFDPRKGYGFIVGPEGQDIFAHYTVIEGDGFRVLRDGTLVKYSAEHSNKGWKATRVQRLADESEIDRKPRASNARSPRR